MEGTKFTLLNYIKIKIKQIKFCFIYIVKI